MSPCPVRCNEGTDDASNDSARRDRHRFEMVYKGQGRLIFAGGSLGNFTGGNLIWIIHNAGEGGYR